MLLCPNHHREATVGAMTQAEQRTYKSDPYNIRRGLVDGTLKVNQLGLIVQLGTNFMVNYSVLLDMTCSPKTDPVTMRVQQPKMGIRRTFMGKRHSPEQIVRKLRQAEPRLAAGATVTEAARELGISETTLHRWRNQYGGMSSQEAKRLKELEKENARPKKLVAEKELDIDILKEVSRGNF